MKTYLIALFKDYTDGNLTGAHRRHLEFINGLLQKGDKVILISGDIPKFEKNENLTHYKVPVKKIMNLPFHISGMIIIWKLLLKNKKNIKYDFAISFNPSITVAFSCARIKNIVSLFRENLIDYAKINGSSVAKIFYLKFLEYKAVKASKKIIVQCQDDKNKLIDRTLKHNKKDIGNIFVQPNNANTSWMKIEKAKLKEEVNDSRVKILFIGNFRDKRKGHYILLSAVAKLIDEGYDIDLILLGDGKDLEICKKTYKTYKNIHFMGKVDNVNDYLSRCDFLMVPSLIDSCPNTVLEAVSCGVVTYGSNVGGIPDILESEAYLFKPNEVDIYRFLSNILATKAYKKDIEEQKKIHDRFTFDWCEKLKNIIES